MLCYNRFNTFNYLKTEDQFYCAQTKDWMQGLIRKSVAFSGQGEKHRNKFLYTAFAACDKLIEEINGSSHKLVEEVVFKHTSGLSGRERIRYFLHL